MKAKIKSLIILLTVILVSSGKSYAQHPPFNEKDSLALVALYNSTGNGDWVSELSPRFWPGVYVNDDYDTRVRKLKLPNRNLTGPLPAQIGDLTECTELILNGNQLSGILPPEINKMVALKTLSLNNNKFTSPIPDLDDLNDLNLLFLQQNEFDGEIPYSIGFLENLANLDLSKNHFTGTIPEAFKNLDKLASLRINDNQLRGELPGNTLVGMINLGELILSNNEFEGEIPPSIGNMPNLAFLWLNGNRLTIVPNEINGLTNLISLYLNDNILYDLPVLHGLPNLGYLNLVGNRLTFEDIIPNLHAAQVINYNPQDSIGYELTILAEIGDSKTLGWEFTAEGNQYQWEKDGVNIDGAVSSEYEVNLLTFEDFGNYIIKVTNQAAPSLTLTTRPLILLSPAYAFCEISSCLPDPDYPVENQPHIGEVDHNNSIGSRFILMVKRIIGEVELYRRNRVPYELRGGETLWPGDRIYTGMESSATLQFLDCSTVVVKELTDVGIASFERLGNAVQAQIWLKAGEVDAAVREESAVQSDFKVRTPTATCSVRGTNFGVLHNSINAITTVLVTEGYVNVSPEFSPADSIMLAPWQKVTVTENSIGPVESFSLTRIEISPDTTEVIAGNKRLFSAVGYDTDGNSTSVQVFWESDGGTFDNSMGLLYAGTIPGEYIVTATEPVNELSATSVVIVKGKAVGVIEPYNNPPLLSLEQNYPNPFVTSTTIFYELPESVDVRLTIFNLLGEQVAELVNEEKAAGRHSFQLNAKELDSGAYFYRLQAGESTAIRKMLLMR